jgi:mono/diheme cytochrome c family protein
MKKRRMVHLISMFTVSLTVTLITGTNALTSTNTRGPNPPSDGAALYASKCAICHGRNGGGTPAWKSKGQPDLSTAEWQKSHSDAQIAERIKQGKGKMPPFGNKLSDEDVAALVKQVRNFRK